MSSQKTLEVVRRIAVTCLGSAIVDNTPLASQIYETGWQQKLSLALREELAIEVSTSEIGSAVSLVKLADLIEPRLARDQRGQSLIDIYAAVGDLSEKSCLMTSIITGMPRGKVT